MTHIKVELEFIPKNSSRDNLLINVQEIDQMVTEILETARLKSEHGQLNREKTDLVKLIQGSCLAFKRTCSGDSF